MDQVLGDSWVGDCPEEGNLGEVDANPFPTNLIAQDDF